MPRKATESGKRVKITFTTYLECVQHINDQRGYMTQSEYIHRLVVEDYNRYNPDRKIKLWEPKEERKEERKKKKPCFGTDKDGIECGECLVAPVCDAEDRRKKNVKEAKDDRSIKNR